MSLGIRNYAARKAAGRDQPAKDLSTVHLPDAERQPITSGQYLVSVDDEWNSEKEVVRNFKENEYERHS